MPILKPRILIPLAAGFYVQLEGYPQINDQFIFEDYEFTVLNCDQRRVIKVRIKKIKKILTG
ncbi:transporter associated domain-containing protein [Acetobacterium paludosum]|uniref:transporter associated domain-containing protein n=1 Tax=Acetobacterium paludosum TaxID=52693 RepID=UPI0014787FC4|nr:transporter associated domain-containing protein [Acetobacterium paludosum]